MSILSQNRSLRRTGFTLPEVLISSVISTMVIGAVVSLSLAATRTYYVESEYIEIGGQSRRLIDRLVDEGSQAGDLAIFRDINEGVIVPAGDRGDCLMIYDRATNGTGNITGFTCYYLARTTPITTISGISLWRFEAGPAGLLTTDPATALNGFNRTTSQRVSSDVYSGPFPRSMPTLTTPRTPREGIFTNDGFRLAGSPTIIVNLPSRLSPRTAGAYKASSNLTFAISPRR